jgi:hypothetical protein
MSLRKMPIFVQINVQLFPKKKVAKNLDYFSNFQRTVQSSPRGEISPNLATLGSML